MGTHPRRQVLYEEAQQRMAKRVYVAATRQHQGKTTTCLGLIFSLERRLGEVGFIKPVGQRYVQWEGQQVDEDSLLIAEVCHIDCHLKDMSPIAIDRYFTRHYIDSGSAHDLEQQVLGSFGRVAQGKEFVIIEGTGHAGVGSVLDMSNARVAQLLQSKVLIVTVGGIGRPIDEILLNAALFKLHDVEIAGVVLNKVLPEKLDMVEHYARKALSKKGIDLFGVVPYQPLLAGPSLRQILEDVGGELLNGEERLDVTVTRTVVGAMSPHRALQYLARDVLLITPGDREDLILAALSSYVVGVEDGTDVSGIVLTGGIEPHRNILRLIRRTPVPVILVSEDTYPAAARIRDLVVKIRPDDTTKIALARRLVNNYVDVEGLLAHL